MSKFSVYTKKSEAEYRKHKKEQVTNFMGGISYEVSPLTKLKIIAASSIFGEGSFYIDKNEKAKMFIDACDEALSYNFKETLEFGMRLRHEFGMRLNSALIVIRAAMHKDRVEFNKKNNSFMKECIKEIMNIPTDIWNQFELWMYFNSTKNRLPTILKKAWAEKLEKSSRYTLEKYKGIAHIIDLVRLCHANSDNINELMRNGKLNISDDEQTWEKLKSAGKTWKEILQTTYVPHMALLRNLRGIFSSLEDGDGAIKDQILSNLENGVSGGRQFAFRYWNALKEIQESGSIKFKPNLIESLNKCIDISMENFPKLKGKTICLSDNSGSAWNAFTSEYGRCVVAEIDNLSSIMTAYNSEEGYIGIFGDRLAIEPVNKRDGILSQLEKIERKWNKNKIGGATENGIWIFFREAIKEKQKYDNIFIYSDMQAGHGGLYGINPNEYSDYIYSLDGFRDGRYIDVMKLVQEYRKKVNPKVNIFSVQTTGYDNSVVPENLYRCSILTGWTGKETVFAKEMIDIWDEMEEKPEKEENPTIKIKTFVNKNHN